MEVPLLNELLEKEENRALDHYNGKAKGSEEVKEQVRKQLRISLESERTKFQNANDKLIVAEMERIRMGKQAALDVCVDICGHP